MFVKLLVRLCGGFWSLKEKCDKSTGIKKKFYIKLFSEILEIKSSYIGYKAHIPFVPTLPHGLSGIFISGDSKLGRNCIIFQQVTIGANNIPESKTKGAPTIGDSVYIGAGAKIIGGITVGNNVRIGANCVVVKDVPNNCVVVNQMSNIIQKDDLVNKYYEKNSRGNWCYLENGKKILVEETEIIAELERVI